MKTEEKRELAEWMGKTVSFHKGWTKIDNDYADQWNPDTDYKQFAEVWNTMDGRLQNEVLSKFGIEDEETGERILCKTGAVGMILNDLPKVMGAVMEVIRAEKL